ncbi:MAG: hypothetical protein ACREXY_01345 [Gammaproteobacteria bacterium]
MIVHGLWHVFATPEAYLDKIETLWSALREPDPSAVASLGRVTNAGQIARAVAAANRGIGLHADHVAVRAGPHNFLREILIC